MATFYCNYCVDIRHGDGLPNEVTYADVHDHPTGDITENPSATAVGQQSHAPEVGYYSFRIFRSLFYFDTSSIPVGATITDVQLRFYVSQTYEISGRSYTIVVQNGQPTYPHNPAVSGDFLHTNYSGNGGEVAYGKYWKTITFNEGARSWVNIGGETKLVLRINRDINNDAPPVPSGSDVNNEFVFIRHATNYYARLIITYTTIPVVTTQAPTQVDSGGYPYYRCAMGNGTIVSGSGITRRGFEVRVNVDYFGVGGDIWWGLIGFHNTGGIVYDKGQRTGYLVKIEYDHRTSYDPELGAYKVPLGKSGVFEGEVDYAFNDALNECESYTYRAYATNDIGTGYGGWVAFNTPCYPDGEYHPKDDISDGDPTVPIIPIEPEIPYPPFEWEYPPEIPYPPWDWSLPPWEMPDYPPMSFVGDFYYKKPYTQKDLDELRKKCIIYNKNSVEFALVLRHNMNVLKEFFNMMTDYLDKDEFNDFTDLIPPQRLKELYLDNLEVNDFKDMINGFIRNTVDNNIAVNRNFSMIQEATNDPQENNEEGVFKEIISNMKTVTEDNPDVDRLKSVIDNLNQEVALNFNEIMRNLKIVRARLL